MCAKSQEVEPTQNQSADCSRRRDLTKGEMLAVEIGNAEMQMRKAEGCALKLSAERFADR
jgi:hypothetical protein